MISPCNRLVLLITGTTTAGKVDIIELLFHTISYRTCKFLVFRNNPIRKS